MVDIHKYDTDNVFLPSSNLASLHLISFCKKKIEMFEREATKYI